MQSSLYVVSSLVKWLFIKGQLQYSEPHNGLKCRRRWVIWNLNNKILLYLCLTLKNTHRFQLLYRMQQYNFSRAFCLHTSLPARSSLLALSNHSNMGWVFLVFIDMWLLFSFPIFFSSPQILMSIIVFLAPLLSFLLQYLEAFSYPETEMPEKVLYFFFLSFWTDN